MRIGAAIAVALALLLVPAALAAGPTISYTVSSGTVGDNGWYRSQVTAQIDVAGANDTTCPAVKTFRTSSDALSCTATDGVSTIQFHLQFKIDTDGQVVSFAPATSICAVTWLRYQPLSPTVPELTVYEIVGQRRAASAAGHEQQGKGDCDRGADPHAVAASRP